MLRHLDRYVLKEILGPVFLGFMVYTFLLLMQFLFRSAEMIIRRDVPADQVGKLLLMTLPNIVVLTIPMSFLFGILVAVGRLASDSEIVALRSCGVSLVRLYRPILALSLVLTGTCLFLMAWTVPRANHGLQELRLEIMTSSATKQVEPRIFYEDWQGVVLYVFEAPPDASYWSRVFVAEDLPGTTSKITVADRGEVRLDESTDRLVLHLEDAVIHEIDLKKPHEYRVSRMNSLNQVLVDRYTMQNQGQVTSSKGVRELTLRELKDQVNNERLSSELRNLTAVEIHKKFALPAVCAVFGLLALPLGYTSGRGSKSSGFALSIAVIMVYYILLNNGEEMARVGRMTPWLAMWLPNMVLTVAGCFLLLRRNRDRTLLLGQVDRWLRRFAWFGFERKQEELREARDSGAFVEVARPKGQVDVVLRLPHFRPRFPNLMDRYVLRLFTGVVVLVLLSGIAIYIVADLTERVDDIFQNNVPRSVVLEYYRYLTLQIVYEISPVAVLVTTLMVFGILSKTNEVTAAKSLGISLYRLAVPAVVAAVLIAVLGGFLQTRILPASNERVAQVKDRIKGRTAARSYRRADRQWLFGQGRYIYNYQLYDQDEQALHQLQVFEFDDSGALTRRLFSAKSRYLGDAWLFDKGWIRSFDNGEVLEYRTFEEPVIDYYPETPAYFESEYKVPDAMTYGELDSYINELRSSGQSVPDLEVELHKKISLPFASIVMSLVALPFSFRLGRRGTLYGVGLGIVLGMVFYALLAFSSTLGETGALPPLLAVWSPNVAFMILSLYLLLGVRS